MDLVFSENVSDQHGEAIEIIKLTSPHSRSSSHSMAFSSDGENYNLNFVKKERNVFTSNTPVWIAESNPENPLKNNFRPLNQIEKRVEGDIYVDHNNSAVFLIRYDNERRQYFYDGVFGENKNKRIVRSNQNKSDFLRNANSADHMIFKSSSTDNDTIDLPTPFTWGTMLEYGDPVLEKVDNPLETLYPKVLVVVDYTIFELMGRNVSDILKYLTVFWNMVDQQYAKIAQPKVEISVTGVVIANSEKSLNFVYNSRDNYPDNGRTYINLTRYANNGARYFYRDFSADLQFDDYHAPAVMTNTELKATGLNNIVLGYANSIGYICRRGLNGALGIDDGRYIGADTFVHELGHLLNMVHDDFDYTFTRCDPVLENDRGERVSQSVMAAHLGLPMHWSECSIQSLTRLASYKVGQCLGSRL